MDSGHARCSDDVTDEEQVPEAKRMAKVAVFNFDWGKRLEQYPEEEHSPEDAFRHVEESLDNGVKQNMIVEMPLDDDHKTFWLAKVDAVYGPLLKLFMVPESKEIIFDVSKKRLFPLGYCQMNRKDLIPPQDIQVKFPHWEQLAIQYLEDVSFDTVSMHFIDGEGVTPIERIKPGSVLDVRCEKKLNTFLRAKVVHNHGGLLQLKYLSESSSDDEVNLTLFYTSKRLSVKGNIKKTNDSPPNNEISQGDIKAIDNLNWPPADLFGSKQPLQSHTFTNGSQFEVIHPETMASIELAILETMEDPSFFRLKLAENPTISIVRNLTNCEDVLPMGWSKDLTIACKPSGSGGHSIHSQKLPKWTSAEDLGFAAGQRLEFLREDPVGGPFQIHTAKVELLKDHILVLKLESDEVKNGVVIVPANSEKIFPVGWAHSNQLPLFLPKSFIPEADIETPQELNKPAQKEEDVESSWCPPIFFNYKCYSSSFLSKARLAGLPKSIGPGPVKLVMREVLNLLIGSSFKSGSVLKRLETKNSVPSKDFVIEELKGKSRVLILKADVEIPTKAHQVRKFCKEVCTKVGACPFLIFTEKYDEETCPTDCQNRPKAGFKEEEDSASISAPKKVGPGGRRKKRRNPERLLLDEQRLQREMSIDRGSTSSEENYSGDTTTAASSRTQSRSNSPSDSMSIQGDEPAKRRRYGKKEWSTLLPKSEMRTRGAKLPDWKLHMKIRPSYKDRKAMEMDEKTKRAENNKSPSDGSMFHSCYDRKSMRPVKVNVGSGASRRSTKRMELPAAFSMSHFPCHPTPTPTPTAPKRSILTNNNSKHDIARENGFTSPTHLPPPPIRKIRLQSNPENWTVNDTTKFLAQTADCSHLAHFMKDDQIDGKAFMLLNYPTVKDYWQLKPSTAIKLCQHVESVRLAHVSQFP